MKLEDLEAKLGIANMGEEDKLALVKDIQANLPALKAEQRVLEAKTQANLVVEAIKKIKEGLEARFDELNGIVDAKVRDVTSGKDGIDGRDGKNGVDGRDGKDGLSITGPKGADGEAGQDGVGVQDAHIDFDGSLIITLTDGRELNVGEVVPMDVAEKIKIIGNGGGTSQSVLDAIAAINTTIATYGTMATQNANAVAITGGSINGATVGATTAATGTFTTLIGGGGSANYFQTQGSATTKSVEVKALGSDTNIAFVIDSKGTGAIDLAAGSSGVNISNGGTVTAITRTNGGTGYTVAPTVTISAPTTAGGVQATATCTVTAGVVDSAFTITNAGSGYVEQPTITFTPVSGGSGAAAYASVGAATTIKTLFGTTTSGLDLATPAGAQVRIADIGDGTRPLQLNGGSAGAAQVAGIYNATSGAALALSTNAGTISFYSGGRTATEQARIAHTASAVNYVQVTGATTASKVVAISAQGSDTDVTLLLSPKGAGTVRFGTYTGTILTPTGYITITDSGGTSRRLLVG